MDPEPLLSVVRGNPADDELAALIAVLVARTTSVEAKPAQPTASPWARSARPSTGLASWRHSALPR